MMELAFSKIINTVLTVDFTFPQRKTKPQPAGKKSVSEKRGRFLGQ